MDTQCFVYGLNPQPSSFFQFHVAMITQFNFGMSMYKCYVVTLKNVNEAMRQRFFVSVYILYHFNILHVHCILMFCLFMLSELPAEEGIFTLLCCL